MPTRKTPAAASKPGEAKVVPLRAGQKGGPSPMAGRKASPRQLETGAAGRAKRNAMAKESARRRAAGEKTRHQKLLDGELTVRDLDDDELSKGRCRDLGGGFAGRAPHMPAHLQQQMNRELLKRGNDRFSQSFLKLIDVLVTIAQDPEEKAADRIKAATQGIERIAGKVPDKVQINSDGTWEATFEGIVYSKEDAG